MRMCCIFIVSMSLYGCLNHSLPTQSQIVRQYYSVEFRNVCDYPVRVVSHYNYRDIVVDLIHHGDSRNVIELSPPAGIVNSENVYITSENVYKEMLLVDTFRLEIHGEGRQISLSKEQFLQVLERADHTDWAVTVISDPSLCP